MGYASRPYMDEPAPPSPPHLDPVLWGELVDSIDAANVFVVLGSWLGQARTEISVEDVWQETLWMAWRDRQQHRWIDLTRYRAWLLGIARNRIGDLVRAAGRHKRAASRTARFTDLGGGDTVSRLLPPQSTTPSRVASNLERARWLERVLGELEPALRDVVRLRLFEELPMEAVAKQLAIPLSTAKHRLVRGMQHYRDAQSRQGGAHGAGER
jgi:RNA polymerase sigma factor (sigma-70 family)